MTTTTDRELLELAAKAAGYNDPIFAKQIGKLWNPLTDDGDALRLVVKLRLIVQVCPNGTQVIHDSFDIMDYVIEEHNGNPCAATRRAIVRAAAEIAKEMK